MICKDILVPNFFSKLCFKDFCSKHFPILLLWTCTKYLLKNFSQHLLQDFIPGFCSKFASNFCPKFMFQTDRQTDRQTGKLADLVTIMLWKGIWGHPYKNNPTSNLGPPSNSGLQRLPIQPLNFTYDTLKQSYWCNGWGTHLSLINHTNKLKAKCK